MLFGGDPFEKSLNHGFLCFFGFFGGFFCIASTCPKWRMFDLEGFVCALTVHFCTVIFLWSIIYQHCLIFPVPFIQEL